MKSDKGNVSNHLFNAYCVPGSRPDTSLAILLFTDRETKGLSCQRTTGIKQQSLDLKLHFF